MKQEERDQIVVKIPAFIELRYNTPEQDLREDVTLDVELVPEIYSLWKRGVRTTGCCSGHGDSKRAYIGVVDEDISKMEELGYEHAPNNLDLSRRDSFYPKSVTSPNTLKEA